MSDVNGRTRAFAGPGSGSFRCSCSSACFLQCLSCHHVPPFPQVARCRHQSQAKARPRPGRAEFPAVHDGAGRPGRLPKVHVSVQLGLYQKYLQGPAVGAGR